MAIAHSPLRYPGGKQVLARVLSHLIRLNGTSGGTYIEPYAGGAGAALALLYGEHVDRIFINDLDRCVCAFWRAVLDQTEEFAELIGTTPTTVDEWTRQRAIYQSPKRYSTLRVGFATFYLNRCNRSGIIASAGPIGGKQQSGTWKIDARFNRSELAQRIRKVAAYRERIEVFNQDGIEFLTKEVASLGRKARPFVYLDPPYFEKGQELYLNSYQPSDHARLARYLKREARFRWALSYDNVDEIRSLYTGLRQVPFNLDYSARDRRRGREIMILQRGLAFPDEWLSRLPKKYVTAAKESAAPLPT